MRQRHTGVWHIVSKQMVTPLPQVPRLPPEWPWDCHLTSLDLLGHLQEAGLLAPSGSEEGAGPHHLVGPQVWRAAAFLPAEGSYCWCGSAWKGPPLLLVIKGKSLAWGERGQWCAELGLAQVGHLSKMRSRGHQCLGWKQEASRSRSEAGLVSSCHVT